MTAKPVDILINSLLRLTGIAPMVGPIPLTKAQYQQLFDRQPSFVDYFPVIDYDMETGVFQLDDNLNVGIAWELSARDLDAKPEETLIDFNQQLSRALGELPIDDDYSYTVQIYLQNAEIENHGSQMKKALPQRLVDDKLSLDVIEKMRDHSDMLTHEHGLFRDNRVNQEKGWRASTQRIYLLIYRKPPESYWKKQRKTPARKLIDDTRSIIMALKGLNVNVTPLDDYGLIRWLAPIFSSGSFDIQAYTREYHSSMRELANYDVGQQCFNIAPKYHVSEDEFERGIYQFGDSWIRYLTTDGLQQLPSKGCLTIAQEEDGAAVWEQFPPGTMICWTIIPEAQVKIDAHIEDIEQKSLRAGSEQADFSKMQIDEAKKQRLINKEMIFYTQIGAYLTADNLESLLEKTYIAIDVIKASKAYNFIRPEHDIISQDSFKSNLPFVYDFEHDRKRSLRARMTYLTQLAATLPLYGVGRGSNNPCYIMYKRSGEPFMYNPYLKSDRARVAHQLVFGPTGAGKSATMVNLSVQSMAINGPRQFVLDKGNSFGLMGLYYEAMGKKVRRYTFDAKSDDTFPPFFETEKALAEVANDGFSPGAIEQVEDEEELDDEEAKRSYISEMVNSLKIMVTGGNSQELNNIKQADINFLQNSLIEGLKSSQEKGKAHATVDDIYEKMNSLIQNEPIESFQIRYREMADALELWTKGIRGKLFNQIGEGFDPDADLTIIETGALTAEGSEDMFAVAGLATLSNITALGERLQYEDRHIEVTIDEGHYWMVLEMLVKGIVQATKVWRKLGIWLTFATQDFSDFPDYAKKILSQAENWLLLSMDEEEAQQISRFKKLTAEEHYLVRQATIEKPNFSEATLLSKRFGCGLNRFIPPSFVLALAQTDKDEKAERKSLMKKHGCTELEAAMMIADDIQRNRKIWQEDKHYSH